MPLGIYASLGRLAGGTVLIADWHESLSWAFG